MSRVTCHMSHVTCHIFFLFFSFFFLPSPPKINIGPMICIGREIQCLPYAGFKKKNVFFWYLCYYPHTSRYSVSPVYGILNPTMRISPIGDMTSPIGNILPNWGLYHLIGYSVAHHILWNILGNVGMIVHLSLAPHNLGR